MNIYEAVGNNDVEAIKEYINNGADVDAKNNGGWTLIHYACYCGYYDIAHLLLKNGADINVRDTNNWTPLHFACQYGHYDIAHLLLKNGADVNTRNNYGCTPLHHACFGDYYDIVHLFLSFSKEDDVKITSFKNFGGYYEYRYI